jgi:hypothetical protein
MVALTQAAAKRDFLTICRRAIKNGERIYVKDKSGSTYLTIDPVDRHLLRPPVQVSAQFFKNNFSRCSSLIKDGLCFRLSLRGNKQTVFARRHTKYSDPCDIVIEKWLNQLEDNALATQQESNLMRVIDGVGRYSESHHAEILEAVGKLKQGIARLSIGHRPFEEGQLPGDA